MQEIALGGVGIALKRTLQWVCLTSGYLSYSPTGQRGTEILQHTTHKDLDYALIIVVLTWLAITCQPSNPQKGERKNGQGGKRCKGIEITFPE